MRSCEEFELLVNLAVDEEATLEELAELNAHLETCPDCRAYCEDIKRIHGLFAQKEIAVPAGFAVRVMERVRETEQDRPAKKVVPFPRWRRWAALAACCAVAVLSVWAFRGTVGFKNAMVAADSAPQAADARVSVENSAAQEPEALVLDGSAAVEDADLDAYPDEAPPPMPEEYEDLAKSAAKDGAAEGDYQPLTGGQSDQETTQAAAAPPEHARESDALPAPNEADQDQPAAARTEDNLSLEDEMKQTEPPGEADEMQNPALPAPAPAEDPQLPDGPETEPEVEPVEVVNVPEPGILVVFGSAAQEWVENVLGLEWAAGGSYPLSAKQYGALLQTLDEAGEPYLIQPGEGYCLMTE